MHCLLSGLLMHEAMYRCSETKVKKVLVVQNGVGAIWRWFDKQIKERPIYWVRMTKQLSADGFFCSFSMHDPIPESRFYLNSFCSSKLMLIHDMHFTFLTSHGGPNNPCEKLWGHLWTDSLVCLQNRTPTHFVV